MTYDPNFAGTNIWTDSQPRNLAFATLSVATVWISTVCVDRRNTARAKWKLESEDHSLQEAIPVGFSMLFLANKN